MSLIRNERLKLLATALNNIGVATIVAGLIAPFIGSGGATQSVGWPWIGIAWLSTGVILHICGQVFLGELKQ